MNNPYVLPDDMPVAAQISGGRTSGFMFARLTEANRGKLNVHYLFQNTGRERPETLDFVQRLADQFKTRITWLEYRPVAPFFETVGHNSASRNGEPFEALIRKKGTLPKQNRRFCTEELKVATAQRYMKSLGFKKWYTAIGFRADERRRVENLKPRPREITLTPLYNAGISKHDIQAYWADKPFDLNLPIVKGKTIGGNCDHCFLKSERERAYNARYFPGSVQWWADMEAMTGRTFDRNVSILELTKNVASQGDWIFDLPDEESPLCNTAYGSCTEY